MEDLVAYFDGSYIPKSKINLNIDNLCFTRGYGAYECFRTYNRVTFRLKDHVKRLKKTCDKLLIPFPNIDFEKITTLLLEHNKDDEIIFRVYVTDHCEKEDECHLIIVCNTQKFYLQSHPTHPLKIKTVPDIRDNKCIKSISYGYSIVEIKKAKKQGYDDVLYVDEDNIINELSKANFFAIKGNALYTPKKNLLLGITRKTILEIAKSANFHVIEQDIPLAFLDQVEEVFLCSTIRSIVPIEKIDSKEFPLHKKTLQLKEAFMSQTCRLTGHDTKNLELSHS